MVPTTTPNPDDTPPKTGTVERQLYPTPSDPLLVETSEQLLLHLVTHEHANERIRFFEGMRPVGVGRVTWMEFDCGTRIEVNGR